MDIFIFFLLFIYIFFSPWRSWGRESGLIWGSFYVQLKEEIEEEKVNSHEVHFYVLLKEEIEEELKRESSFALDLLDVGNREGWWGEHIESVWDNC